MKRYWRGAVVFIIGFVIGGSLMGYLAMNASKTYLHGVKLNFEIQQEATAYHFLKLGDYQRALVHYKNLADSQGGKNIYAFQPEYSQWPFSFPLAAIILEQIGKANDPDGKGRRSIEGITRGNLASVMEKLHMQKESEEQWRISAELAGHSDVAKMKKTVSFLQEKGPDMSQLMVVFDKNKK